MSQPDISPQSVQAREADFVLGTYGRTPFHPRSGRGAKLFDAEGRAYWDLLGGIAVNALGHGHPALVRALRKAATSPLHVSNLYYHPTQGLLAERLVGFSGLSRAFFCNSGTEANEAAIKFARLKNPGRSGFVALRESFHGRTLGALSITGHDAYRQPFEPLVPQATFIEPNDIEALERAVTPDVAAIIVEPILGEAGVIPLTPAFLRAAREISTRTGALLICDEIQCGLGRSGSMFAYQDSKILPDIVTLAKSLGGGLPLGAVLTGPALEGVVKPGHHGTTFGGNPVACSLALAFLDVLEQEDLSIRAKQIGGWFERKLSRLAKTNSAIVDVRGRGLMWGIELDRPAKGVASELFERGFIVGTARESVIRLLPPLIVTKSALLAFITELADVLGAATAERQQQRGAA